MALSIVTANVGKYLVVKYVGDDNLMVDESTERNSASMRPPACSSTKSYKREASVCDQLRFDFPTELLLSSSRLCLSLLALRLI